MRYLSQYGDRTQLKWLPLHKNNSPGQLVGRRACQKTRYSLRSTIFDFHSKIFDLRMRIFDPLGGPRPPEHVTVNWDGATQNTNQIQLRFRRASNIDFCMTYCAIVKVLCGQGGHFGAYLGPKRHPPERDNGPGRPVVPDLGYKFCRKDFNHRFL